MCEQNVLLGDVFVLTIIISVRMHYTFWLLPVRLPLQDNILDSPEGNVTKAKCERRESFIRRVGELIGFPSAL